jgi:hypothetical protein
MLMESTDNLEVGKKGGKVAGAARGREEARRRTTALIPPCHVPKRDLWR